MNLFAFWVIHSCFAAVWSGFGLLEVLAYFNGVLITLAAAVLLSIFDIEGE
jgi:hypothetical protein